MDKKNKSVFILQQGTSQTNTCYHRGKKANSSRKGGKGLSAFPLLPSSTSLSITFIIIIFLFHLISHFMRGVIRPSPTFYRPHWFQWHFGGNTINVSESSCHQAWRLAVELREMYSLFLFCYCCLLCKLSGRMHRTDVGIDTHSFNLTIGKLCCQDEILKICETPDCHCDWSFVIL